MSDLEERLREDRELRDAARAVLMSDVEHLKSSLSAKEMFSRVGSRIGDGAVDVFETAKEQAADNRGIIAALIGAILLWLGREPILDALGLGDQHEGEAGERDPAATNEIPLGDNS